MTLAEIFTLARELPWWAILVGILLGAVTVKKLQLPVWDWVVGLIKAGLAAFGKYLTAAVMEELAEVRSELSDLNDRLNIHITTADLNWAEGERQHILDFSTGLANGTRYDHEAFRQVLSSVDKYEDYCKTHPDYPNSMAVAAIEHVRQAYHNFLIHKEDAQ